MEGALDSGASHLFVNPATHVESLDPSIRKSVHIADGTIVRTTGCGTINGMPAHVGPFSSNLISVRALQKIGVHTVFSEDPHILVTRTGLRYGTITFSESGGYRAKIPIRRTPDAIAMPAGYTVKEPDDDENPFGPGYGKGPKSGDVTSQALQEALSPVLRLPNGNSKVFDTPASKQQARLHSIFHASAERLAQGVNRGHLINSAAKSVIKGVSARDLKWNCVGCMLGKCRKPTHPISAGTNRATRPWQRMDLPRLQDL